MVCKVQAGYPQQRPTRTRQSRLLCGCAIGAVALSATLATPGNVYAQSLQGTSSITLGSATITTGANTTTVDVGNSAQTVIRWTPSNTASAGVIQFQDAGTTANYTSSLTDYTVLNRILSPVPTDQIRMDGNVTSTAGGRIWFYTPGGFIIGSTARFDVGSLVLTTSDIDETGGLLGGAGTNQIRFTGAAGNSAIKIETLAELKANGSSSYIALVAPRIEQGGKIAVEGSAALVAAESATITLNNGLLNIDVGTGTDDENGIVHTGTTTGITAAADPKAIYMVAVPKNDAVTMLLGGLIGHQAASASASDGAIVLSSGSALNITGDARLRAANSATVDLDNAVLNVSGALTVAAGNGPAGQDIKVNIANGSQLTVGSNLVLDASGKSNAATVAGGDIAFNISGASSALNVGGTTTLDSSSFIQGIDGGAIPTGSASSGAINIGFNGGNVTLNGLHLMTSSRITGANTVGNRPDNGGATIGGTATLAVNGSTVSTGLLTIDTSASTGVANLLSGDAIAGGVQFSVSAGSAITTADFSVNSSAFGGASSPTQTLVSNGNATGGAIDLSVSGSMTSNGTVSLDSGVQGNLDEGFGRGGNINVAASGSSAVLRANGGLFATLSARGRATEDAGTTSKGGNFALSALSGGQFLTFGQLSVNTNVEGLAPVGQANATAPAVKGGSIAIHAEGGTINVAGTNGLFLDSFAQVERYTGAGMALLAQGGDIDISAVSSGALSGRIESGYGASVFAGAIADSGGTSGGSAKGGIVNMTALGGAIVFSDLAVSAAATGGFSDAGSANGTAQGGEIHVAVGEVASTRPISSLSLSGSSNFDTSAGFAVPDVELVGIGASAVGGSATGGNATGGSISFDILSGTLTTSDMNLLSEGRAAEAGTVNLGGTPFVAGNGTGGSIAFTVDGGAANLGTLTLVSLGVGGNGAPGLLFAGEGITTRAGFAGNGIGGDSNLVIKSGSLTTSTIIVSSQGIGGIPGDDPTNTQPVLGGFGQGGSAALTLGGTGGTLTAATVQLSASGTGGSVSNSPPGESYPSFSIGGAGTGGAARVNLLTGTANIGTLLIDANGVGGAGAGRINSNGGTGGSGTGGTAVFNLVGSTIGIASVSVQAKGDGGSGGTSGEIRRVCPDTCFDTFFPGTGNGGTGGNGTGGGALVKIGADPSIGILEIDVSGQGAAGGNGVTGGAGGNGIGGFGANGALLNITASTFDVTTMANIFSSGFGGDGGSGTDGVGGTGGNGVGGDAAVTASGANTVLNINNLSMSTAGFGGDGGASGSTTGGFVHGSSGGGGSGGRINLAAGSGASITLAGSGTELDASGSGASGNSGGDGANPGNGGNGGDAHGGQIAVSGAGGAISVLSDFQAFAYGEGGSGGGGGSDGLPNGLFGAGGNGGSGYGGSVSVDSRFTNTDATIQLSGNSIGGAGGSGSRGGNAGDAKADQTSTGVHLTFSGGASTVRNILVSAAASAGYGGSGETLTGGSGGDAAAGAASITVANGSSLVAGSFGTVSVDATAFGNQGGGGRAGGSGGDAAGGTATLTINGQATFFETSINAGAISGNGADGLDGTSNALFSDGSNGGAGGNATGGSASIVISGAGSRLLTTQLPGVFAGATAGNGGDGGSGYSGGSGGAGGGGGAGGSVTNAGSASIIVNGGTLIALDAGTDGPIEILAIGDGGRGGGAGFGSFDKPNGAAGNSGNATGGLARFNAIDATVNLGEIVFDAGAFGGGDDGDNSAPGQSGFGQGGSVQFLVDNSQVSAPSITLAADGFGGNLGKVGATTNGAKGGNGVGGEALFTLRGINSILDVDAFGLSATGHGGEGGSGSSFSAPATGNGGAGGDGFGGTATFTADVDPTIAFVSIDTSGTGGDGGSGVIGGGGGLGAGGGAAGGAGSGSVLALTGGQLTIDAALLSSVGTGGNAGSSTAGAGSVGGEGRGGKILVSADGSTSDLSIATLDLVIGGIGGRGGNGGFSTGTGFTGGTGGAATGGTLTLSASGQASLTTAGLVADVSALGGAGGIGGTPDAPPAASPAGSGANGADGSTPGANGQDGGTGQAGANGAAGATGGNGGSGGLAKGGTINILNNAGAISLGIGASISFIANGQGGAAGEGGQGGSGGRGQQGGSGGSGGNGAQGAPGGFAGGNGGSGGTGGQGGNGGVGGRGGDAGIVGQGEGGSVLIESAGGTLDIGLLTVAANGIGGVTANGGSAGLGGEFGYGGLGGTPGLGGPGGSGPSPGPTGTSGNFGLSGPNGSSGGEGSPGGSSGLSISYGGDITIRSARDGNGNGGAITLGQTALESLATTDIGDIFNSVPGTITISNLNGDPGAPALVIESLTATVGGLQGFGAARGIAIETDQSDILVGDNAFLTSAESIRFSAVGEGQFIALDRIFGNAEGQITITHEAQPGDIDTIRSQGLFLSGRLGIDAQPGTILQGQSGGVHLTSSEGSILTDDLRALYVIEVFAARDVLVKNAATTGFSPSLSAGGTIDLRAGYRFDRLTSSESYVPATATISGNVNSSTDILVQSGGDVIVSPGAKLSAANFIGVASGDDIIVGNGAALKSGQAPTSDFGYGTLTDIRIAAGSVTAIGADPDEVKSFIAGTALFEAPGSAIDITADATQAPLATFNSSTFSALIPNAPATAGGTDGGQLSANCVQGNICLGNISAVDEIRVSSDSGSFGLANKVFITGQIASDRTSIRSRDTLTFDAGVGGLTINGASSLFLESTDGDIVFNGLTRIMGGSDSDAFNIAAENGSIVGGNARLISDGNIALAADRDIRLFSIDAGGALGTYQFDSSPDPFIDINGTFAATDHLTVGAGNIDISADSGIVIGAIGVGSLAAVRLSSLGDVSVGSTGANGFGIPSNVDISGRNIDFGSLNAAGDITASATANISGSIFTAGDDATLSSAGRVDISNVNATGVDGMSQVVISGTNGIFIGNANVTGGLDLTASNGNIRVTGDLDASGTVNATGQDIGLNSQGSLTLGTANATSGNLAVTAEGVLAINQLAAGTVIDLRSFDVAIGSNAQIGAQGRTTSVSFTNIGSRQTYIGGNGGTSTYGIANAELQRVFGNDISIVANGPQTVTSAGQVPASLTSRTPDVILDTLTLTAANGQSGATAGNIGTSGRLRIQSSGKLRTIGAVTLNNLGSGNRFEIEASDMIEIDPATGSISLKTAAGGLGGTLSLTSDDIVAVSGSALNDVINATGIAAIDTRLGTNDGTPNDDGVLRADTIQVNARLGFYVQNTGANGDAGNYDARRGITVGAGGLRVVTGSSTTRIVINGRQLAATGGATTGLNWIPLVQFSGAVSTTTRPSALFDIGSTINGCAIRSPAACGFAGNLDPVNSARDIINRNREEEGTEGGGGNLLPLALIELKDLDGLPYQPVIDDPVTGSGNDDLWAIDDGDEEKGGESQP